MGEEKTISEVSRRNLFDRLRLEGVSWAGRVEEVEFLDRVYDLGKIASTDGRFRSARGDILQHRVNNPTDWPDDWVFNDRRFNLLRGSDEDLLRFLCEMVHPVVRPDEKEAAALVKLFNEELAADGWEIVEHAKVSGKRVFAPRRRVIGSGPAVAAAKAVAEVVDATYVSRQITRMEAAIPTDPDSAIGTAKEFVETICKTILHERGVESEKGWDLPKLVKTSLKQLRLSPDDIPSASKASETIRRLLSNLATVANSLAELRNLYGTGHGKRARLKGLTSRHARLAVGAATTLGVFLFETHQERRK